MLYKELKPIKLSIVKKQLNHSLGWLSLDNAEGKVINTRSILLRGRSSIFIPDSVAKKPRYPKVTSEANSDTNRPLKLSLFTLPASYSPNFSALQR